MSRLVTSHTNPTVKAVKALHMRKAREESGTFLAEGLKVVTEGVELGQAPTILLYGKDAPALLVTRPRDGKPATFANGGTVGFVAPSRDAVHQFHAAGTANGGTCEGPPGPRTFTPTAYAAYLRDPDGNKLCTYCFAPA